MRSGVLIVADHKTTSSASNRSVATLEFVGYFDFQGHVEYALTVRPDIGHSGDSVLCQVVQVFVVPLDSSGRQ